MSNLLFPEQKVCFEDQLKEIKFGLFEGLSYSEISN